MSDDAALSPARHYDRVTDVWGLLLGPELHYGLFSAPDSGLQAATQALTQLMLDRSAIAGGHAVLDVGCGTGAQACQIARRTGASVTGITISSVGLRAARGAARAAGLDDTVRFESRDGTDNGFPDERFHRVWVLESSHLMRRRDHLISECARVLVPGGRLALCDIMLGRPLSLREVRALREPLVLLRNVFGDARMDPMARYIELAQASGLVVTDELDLTSQTRPTFDRWRGNAHRRRAEVIELVGEPYWRQFLEACDVLERFWDDGTLGYGLITADKP